MLQNELKRADLLLLLFYITYCAAIILRINVEATGYTTIDSHYYLEAARSFTDGEQFFIRTLHGPDKNTLVYFTAWPVGYPVLIATAAWLSKLNLFWASKLVNLLFVGLGFLLLRKINRSYAFVLASMYGAFTFVEVYSYTWSEAVFLFGCLCLVVVLERTYTIGRIVWAYLLLITAVFLFLTRYIGIFAGALTLSLALITWAEERKRLSKHLFIAFILNVLFVWAYVLHNYIIAGYNTDLQRLAIDAENIPATVWLTAKGLLIELFLIRKYYLHGQIDLLTLSTTAFQVLITGYVVYALRHQRAVVMATIKKNRLSHVAVRVAAVYLLVLLTLRSISPFDAPDYRLLSPVSILLLFAVLYCLVELPDAIKGAKRVKYTFFIFFTVSLLLNLPKEFILTHLKQLF
ncbi:hypothetical protein ACSX1A_16160 [Pontibacter sp. MBLB2868]|uniref:hypothetical protein n=1 Tax=Pontibacter sp. MBLB2868 TaxID=3451555 RepID=UPI003F74E3FC